MLLARVSTQKRKRKKILYTKDCVRQPKKNIANLCIFSRCTYLGHLDTFFSVWGHNLVAGTFLITCVNMSFCSFAEAYSQSRVHSLLTASKFTNFDVIFTLKNQLRKLQSSLASDFLICGDERIFGHKTYLFISFSFTLEFIKRLFRDPYSNPT